MKVNTGLAVFIGGCLCGVFWSVLLKNIAWSPRNSSGTSLLHSLTSEYVRDIIVGKDTRFTAAPRNLRLSRVDQQPASDLLNKVSILVLIMTQDQNLQSKAAFIQKTWGSRVNRILFVSESYDPDFPTMNLTYPVGRQYVANKTFDGFDYIYTHYGRSYDWFMYADDDTYVIVENLRYFLSDKNPQDPVHYGNYFKTIVAQGYHSGGAGFVLSREALRRFGQRDRSVCVTTEGDNDWQMGTCLEKLGVLANETIDRDGRTRFHCFKPGAHLRGGFPDWFYEYDKYGGKKAGQVSDYAVTFHYMSIDEMSDLEFYLYHLKVYGDCQ